MRQLEYHRTPDFYRAKTKLEKIYYSAGIPSSAWKQGVDIPVFEPVTYRDKFIPPDAQASWYSKFSSDPTLYKSPYLVMIGSRDEEHTACNLAYEMMKFALTSKEIGARIQITNSSAIDEEDIREEIVFMLNNVFIECENDRIQKVRDWISAHEENFRVIAIGGDPSIFAHRCRIKPNVLLYVAGMKDSRSFV